MRWNTRNITIGMTVEIASAAMSVPLSTFAIDCRWTESGFTESDLSTKNGQRNPSTTR